MKKCFSVLLPVSLLLSLLTLPVSAQERENICAYYSVRAYHEIGLNKIPAYCPELLFDTNVNYFGADSSTYSDNRLLSSQRDALRGKSTHYALTGEEDPNSPYLCIIFFELDAPYQLDGFSFYCSDAENDIPSNLNIDGFDILVSQTGEASDWTTVYSDKELHCGKQYKFYEIGNGKQVAYITADFESIEAQYVAFALTQTRCLHKTALRQAYDMEISDHPEYFRMTELEFYGAEVISEEEFPPGETLAPAVTTEPLSATPVTLNHEAILITILLVGMVTAALLLIRRPAALSTDKININPTPPNLP